MAGATGQWVVRRRVSAALLIGDLLVILALVAWGLTTHYVDPLDRPVYTLRTAAPFLLGWLVMAPIAGAFSSRAYASLPAMAVAAAAAWIGAALVGVAIRATPLLPGGADPIFVLVMVAAGLVTVLPWRVLVSVAAPRFAAWPTT